MSKKQAIPDQSEADMIASFESAGYEEVSDLETEVKRLTQIFKDSGNKVKRVNIRMTERDVEKAQAMALREGIPYATLLTNILHRYFTGRLKDKHC